jgi:hypothetical protein
MNQSAPTRAVQRTAWSASSEHPVLNQEPMPSTLVGTLLAVKKQRGALFMLDASRWLIERWDLERDRLQEQSKETIGLVQRLLKP